MIIQKLSWLASASSHKGQTTCVGDQQSQTSQPIQHQIHQVFTGLTSFGILSTCLFHLWIISQSKSSFYTLERVDFIASMSRASLFLSFSYSSHRKYKEGSCLWFLLLLPLIGLSAFSIGPHIVCSLFFKLVSNKPVSTDRHLSVHLPLMN